MVLLDLPLWPVLLYLTSWRFILFSWQNDVFVVAEPGELADKFLQSVKLSFLSIKRGRRRKDASLLSNISTISALVAFRPCFQIGGIVHRYIGRQTQVCFFDLYFFSVMTSSGVV